jgi:hypothetical protein
MLNKLRKSTEKAKETSHDARADTESVDTSRGNRLREECEKTFGGASGAAMGRVFGVDGNSYRNWTDHGREFKTKVLKILAEHGGDIGYVLTGIRATGACQHGKLCEHLPTRLRLEAAILERLCLGDAQEREEAASLLAELEGVLAGTLKAVPAKNVVSL